MYLSEAEIYKTFYEAVKVALDNDTFEDDTMSMIKGMVGLVEGLVKEEEK